MTPDQALISSLLEQVRELQRTQPLVDVTEAAKFLGVSTKTVRRLVAADAIPFKRVGRSLRFNLSQLALKR